ncbi:adenosylmethionine decarboxylase [Zavarzinia sp. CC-PAN008]|uniref:adenosylmethionine decarboxylase n=1 Tax=Zavarzinia sp. CC-PAN008 TaxID=3243332 RepID=UPI003F749D9F
MAPAADEILGIHLIADLAAQGPLDDPARIETMLVEAAAAARVRLLEVRLHHFGDGQGVTGVALLAESHISVHSWPERALAAVDIFVCGAHADPQAALEVIRAHLDATILRRLEVPRLGRP